MSMLLMVKAMQVKVGSPMRKLVLVKLADNASDTGECFPSYQHIADHCEMDRSTVRRHIKALEDQGLLRIENRAGPKGNTSNLYILDLDPVGTAPTPVGTAPTPVGTVSTPPVGTVSTITSHSFKPVNEPVNEPVLSELAFETFWKAGLVKVNKKKALAVFTKICKDKKLDPATFAEQLANDIGKRLAAKQMGIDALHPTSYLNGERWEDEIVAPRAIAKPAQHGHFKTQAELDADNREAYRILFGDDDDMGDVIDV